MFTIYETGIADVVPAQLPERKSKASDAERLHRALVGFRDSTAAAQVETKRAQEWASSPLASYLLKGIDGQQARQLTTVDQIVTSLEDALHWTYSEHGLPPVAGSAERAEALGSIARLAKLEVSRAKQARRLAKSYKGIDGGLEQALLEASAATSDSNAMLLKFALKALKAESGEARQLTGKPQPRTEERERIAA